MLLIILIAVIIIISVVAWEYYRDFEVTIPSPPIVRPPPPIPPSTVFPSEISSYDDLKSKLNINSKDSPIERTFKDHIIKTSSQDSIFSVPVTYFNNPQLRTFMVSSQDTGEKVNLIVSSLFADEKLKVDMSLVGKYPRENFELTTHGLLHEIKNIMGVLRTPSRTDFVTVDLTPIHNENNNTDITIIKLNNPLFIEPETEFYLHLSYNFKNPAKDSNIGDGYCR